MNNQSKNKLDELIITDEFEHEKGKIVDELIKKVSNLSSSKKINGVVIGKLDSIANKGKVYVSFHLNPDNKPLAAYSTFSFDKDDIGCDVALIFQDGNLYKPVVLGPIINEETSNPKTEIDEKSNEPFEIYIDKKRITLNAAKEILLKCGKASITLTSAGKILIRGKYLLSRSSGVNKIKGGSVQIN